MNTSSDNTAPPSRLSAILAALIVLLIFLLPAAGFWWLRGMSQAAIEQNRLSHTRDMLIRHMARTGGRWPESWDDLADDFEPADANYGTSSIDVLKQTIAIDFAFDITTVGKANLDRPPRLLWLKNSPDTKAVAETNDRLVGYLRSRHPSSQRP